MTSIKPGHACHYCGGRLDTTGDVCNDHPDIPVAVCRDCGTRQLSNFDHIRRELYADDGYFPADVAPVLEREAEWNRNRVRRLRDLLPNAARRIALDYGCGPGGFLRVEGGLFARCVGFDLSPRMAALNRADGLDCHSRPEELPADTDTLLLFHVLEHVPDPKALLSELLQRFPRIDRVVVEVPNTQEALVGLFDNAAYRANHFSAEHLWYFTNRTLRLQLEAAGLEVIVDSQLQRYTLGNTFGWLGRNAGGGQHRWPFFNDPALNAQYERVLTEAGAADSVFMVARPASCPR